MSSEDSDGDNKDKLYKVTRRECRRDCDHIMVALDDNHLAKRLMSGKWGRIPVPRIRPGTEPSERPAPDHWPRALYNDEWWQSLSLGEKRDLARCNRVFMWEDLEFA